LISMAQMHTPIKERTTAYLNVRYRTACAAERAEIATVEAGGLGGVVGVCFGRKGHEGIELRP
jgi:hypothetical protein